MISAQMPAGLLQSSVDSHGWLTVFIMELILWQKFSRKHIEGLIHAKYHISVLLY